MSVSMKKAAEMVKQILSVNLVPFLQGSPGIGKSAIIKEVANGAKLKVIDLRLSQCEPTDLLGLPVLSEKKAKYKAFDTFPLEKDKVPAGYNGWLLFLDELNSAPRSVQVAAYKIVLDRMVGQEKLNDKVYIVAKGKIISIETNEETGCTVTQDLGDGYTAIYGQLKELTFDKGDDVECGQVVGYVSEPTKYYSVEGSNLYFAMEKDGKPIDPTEYLCDK